MSNPLGTAFFYEPKTGRCLSVERHTRGDIPPGNWYAMVFRETAASEREARAEVERLRADAGKHLRMRIEFGDIIANHIIAMQAAVIAARLQSPAEGIEWIENTLCGPGARPAHPDWFRSLEQQCRAAGVAFFLKQLGGSRDKRGALEDLPQDLRVREFPNAA